MLFDHRAIRRHRWIVIALILTGAGSVMLAAGTLYFMRHHMRSTEFIDDVHQQIIAEVDYRLAMAGFTVMAFAVGLFLFFIALCLDISYRQKAIILYVARQRRPSTSVARINQTRSE